jgi:hypothetical protein
MKSSISHIPGRVGEYKANVLGSAAVALRTCTVSFSGPSGIRHSVDVTAESRLRSGCVGSVGSPEERLGRRRGANLKFTSENRPRVTASRLTRFIGGVMGLRPAPTRP